MTRLISLSGGNRSCKSPFLSTFVFQINYHFPFRSFAAQMSRDKILIICVFLPISEYRNDPKFPDRQIWANSADPDQTAPAPRGAV